MKRLLATALMLSLAACGGSSGGSRVTEGNQENGSLTGNFAPDVTPGTATGVAHDAPMVNAAVRAYSWENGIASPILGETQTDDVGDYSLEITSLDDELIIQAGITGYYIEESSGTRIDLRDGEYLTAIVGYEVGDTINAQITPMTHLAACYATYLVDNEGLNRVDARIQANGKFSGWAGVDILRTKPMDVSDPNNVAVNLDDRFSYGFITAGISQTMMRVSEENGIAPHSSRFATSISWSIVACSDIQHDGLLNGINENGQMALGTFLVTTDFYRSIGSAILQFAQSDRNATSLTTDDVFTLANQLSISGDEVFGGVAGQAVDIDGPTIEPSLPENSLVNGTIEIPFTVEDALRVDEVTFFIDDNLYATTIPSDPVLNWNTSVFDDGEHTVRVVARDVLGNESQLEVTYRVVNLGTEINITSPALTNNPMYMAMGSYVEGVAAIDRVEVAGVLAELDEEAMTWEAKIPLTQESTLVTAILFDDLGNETNTALQVTLDTGNPDVRPLSTTARFFEAVGASTYNLCSGGELDNNPSNPVCLLMDNVSLNGTEIRSTMTNDGFVIVRVLVSDNLTGIDDLLTEYQYYRNGELISDWRPSPVSLGTPIVPITVEYLDELFHTFDNSVEHRIKFRTTDEAGNLSEENFVFRLQLFNSDLSIVSRVENDEIFDVLFSQRHTIDGKQLNIAYEFTHNSRFPTYISIDTSDDHIITQTYERAHRENRARIVEQEEWQVRFVDRVTSESGSPTLISDWISVDSLTLKNDWNLNNTGINPLFRGEDEVIQTTVDVGEYRDYTTDNVSAPSVTAWVNLEEGRYCVKYSGRTGDLYALYGTYQGTLQPVCFISLREVGSYYNQNSADLFWRQRTSYYAENQPGYPRNVRSISDPIVTQNVVSTVTVFNETEGEEILPLGGWHEIPGNSRIKIVKNIDQPILIHYNDTRVASEDVPYESILLDKSISWELDPGITIHRKANLETDAISGSQILGEKIISYNLSR